jgi:hypothetical protein
MGTGMTRSSWLDWLTCLGMSIHARQWRAVRYLVTQPRFSCAVIWCYVNGYGNWCEWVCGLPGLTARVGRGEKP